MSSHHIWLRCPAPDCDALGDVYTGAQDIDGFELAADYEQETITARCDEHSAWTPGPDETTEETNDEG